MDILLTLVAILRAFYDWEVMDRPALGRAAVLEARRLLDVNAATRSQPRIDPLYSLVQRQDANLENLVCAVHAGDVEAQDLCQAKMFRLAEEEEDLMVDLLDESRCENWLCEEPVDTRDVVGLGADGVELEVGDTLDRAQSKADWVLSRRRPSASALAEAEELAGLWADREISSESIKDFVQVQVDLHEARSPGMGTWTRKSMNALIYGGARKDWDAYHASQAKKAAFAAFKAWFEELKAYAEDNSVLRVRVPAKKGSYLLPLSRVFCNDAGAARIVEALDLLDVEVPRDLRVHPRLRALAERAETAENRELEIEMLAEEAGSRFRDSYAWIARRKRQAELYGIV